MIRQRSREEDRTEKDGLNGYPNSKASDQIVCGMGSPLKVKVKSKVVRGVGITAQISSVTHFNGNKTVRTSRHRRRRPTKAKATKA